MAGEIWTYEGGNDAESVLWAIEGPKDRIALVSGEGRARLIAAAPDMLAALKAMVAGLQAALPPNSFSDGSWADTMPHMDEPMHDALDAIAKAEDPPMTQPSPATHSPLPWRRGKGVQGYGGVRIEAANGVLVAWCGESTSVSAEDVAKNNPPADAALILHRVNTWDGLLAALTMIDHDLQMGVDLQSDQAAWSAVRTAIAQAEEPTDDPT